MSSWWAGYYGSGLKLNEKEFLAFQEKYLEVNELTKLDIIHEVATSCEDLDYDEETMEEDVFREYGYVWSEDKKKRFYIVEINDDSCDGMHLSPYYSNGHPNVEFYNNEDGVLELNPDYKDLWFLGENSYVAFSERSLDDYRAFDEKPYGSYEEFVQEFKDKFGRYLPEDFDWDAHIGRISYAAYA